MASTLRRLLAPAVAATFAAASLGACLQARGDACSIDSECQGGYACSPNGTCMTFAELEAYLKEISKPPPLDAVVDTGPAPDTAPGDDVGPDGCQEPAGAFEPGAAPCPEPSRKLKVTLLAIQEAGHGTAGFAFVGNPILEEAFNSGASTLYLWIDGSFAAGCAFEWAWLVDPGDRGADCTTPQGTKMPVIIPNLEDPSKPPLISFDLVVDAIDPATGRVSGYVDRQQMLDNSPESLHEVITNVVQLDVDTDDDGTPDKASAIIFATLQDAP